MEGELVVEVGGVLFFGGVFRFFFCPVVLEFFGVRCCVQYWVDVCLKWVGWVRGRRVVCSVVAVFYGVYVMLVNGTVANRCDMELRFSWVFEGGFSFVFYVRISTYAWGGGLASLFYFSLCWVSVGHGG